MGTDGELVVKEDGTVGIASGAASIFDLHGGSCCCDPPPYPCEQSSELEESYSVEFDNLPFNFDWSLYPPQVTQAGGIVDFDTKLQGPTTGGGRSIFAFIGRSNVDVDPDYVIPKSRILHSKFEGLTILSCSGANSAEPWARQATFPATSTGFVFTLLYDSTKPGEVRIGNDDFSGNMQQVGTQTQYPLPISLERREEYTIDSEGRYIREYLFYINGVLKFYGTGGYTGYTVDNPKCPERHNGITFAQILGGFFGSDLCSWKLRRPVWGYNTSDGNPSLRYDPSGTGAAHWNYNIGEAISYPPIVLNMVAPFVFSIASGSLPFGTALGGASGIVTGNPVSVGGGEVSIGVIDSNGNSATSPVYSWAGTIVDFPPPDADPLELSYPSPFTNSATPPSGSNDWRLENGGATITPTAAGGVEPYSFTATGLPTGCSILPSGGEIVLPGAHNQVTTDTGTCEITLTDNDGTPIVVNYDWERIGTLGP